MTPHRRTVLLATVLALAATTLVCSTAAADRNGNAWFTSWAQSQQNLAGRTLEDQSVRMITHLSQGGDAVRIRVQNTFGTEPLTVDSTTVGLSTGGASVKHVRPVTFSGSDSVTVQPGGEVWSDAAHLVTRPDQDIAVSMHVVGEIAPGQHRDALRDNYLTPSGSGVHTADTSGAAYTETVSATYLVSAVDVRNHRLQGTVVPYGSSVVDGIGSTNCGPGCTEWGTNQRWADALGRRIVSELPPTDQLAVANAGISGTTSAVSCPSMPESVKGLDASTRLERDVLSLHGVTAVIYYYGTNDLAAGCDAEDIVDSYREVFHRLHDAGIDVYVTPITPRPSYTDEHNLHRHTVGDFVEKWGSCSATCDGVVDFDQVLKDPLYPNSIKPAYDTGDGIHANIAGQKAIAEFISLPMLASSARR
jgi:lysophospholipase L1-like esterase